MYPYKFYIRLLFIANLFAYSHLFAQNKEHVPRHESVSGFQIALFVLITCVILALIYYVLNKRQKRKFNE
ncbi:hypothetical protein [Olivibacter sitiensis]|uniref:hypothetical protein n=1 Tax=Olivibacter sitiensis TaxID=376470 RepID=UPI000414E810|nr:hypothetical protein [Olivibacter sitiensis]